MTAEQLQTTADGLASIDAQLAALPADGRLKQEIQAVRDGLDGVIKLTAQSIRQLQDA